MTKNPLFNLGTEIKQLHININHYHITSNLQYDNRIADKSRLQKYINCQKYELTGLNFADFRSM